jgi:hypothetical protein
MKDIDYADFEPVGNVGSVFPDDIAAEAPAPVVERRDASSGGRVYRLLAPLMVEGVEVREIVLAPLTQDILDAYANGEVGNRRALLCRSAGVHPAVIDALIWSDSEAVHQLFTDMLPDFLKG